MTGQPTNDDCPFDAWYTPRLGIRHFMLWMLFSAVYLAAMRAIHSIEPNAPAYRWFSVETVLN